MGCEEIKGGDVIFISAALDVIPEQLQPGNLNGHLPRDVWRLCGRLGGEV